jgi:hypothetical protein
MNFKLTFIVIIVLVILNKSIEFKCEGINFYRKLSKIIYDLESHINLNKIGQILFEDTISSKLLNEKNYQKIILN